MDERQDQSAEAKKAAMGKLRYPGAMTTCPLCSPLSDVVWENEFCQVIAVAGEEGHAFPGYCRVVWRRHAAEMTDLSSREQQGLLRVVLAVEGALRSLLHPDKINLACLGNMVPHLHWHIVPRWQDDSHFPAAIWGPAVRPAPLRAAPGLAALRESIAAHMATEAD